MAFLSYGSDFTPLFRLLDDYETHRSRAAPSPQSTSAVSKCTKSTNTGSTTPSTPTRRTYFSPAFDVRELNDAYYLDGELPGVDQSNIEIEFTEPQTLVVKGHTERNYSSLNAPATGLTEEHRSNAPDDTTPSSSRANSPHRWHQPTVEDDDEDMDGHQSDTRSTTSHHSGATPSAATVQKKQPATRSVVKTGNNDSSSSASSKTKFHYWASERSIGEFQRTFTFPVRVDQDNVRASLKNGILSVIVPKEAAPKTKKIRIC
ncbi:30 kDa heat shock protein [Penicillium diatomitis]|uniref:30 kDa heat shock protein n=1 Tax=Penicillium diatomitis TaxID=2819901 RepID=A0A9X0BNZ1_9EURO|nr:30 kDa heat shock protein [Penicillium diatomitis]KAJ5477248.1 30 kDa heat shock protein [Penicillium diatomitis]